MCDVNLGRRDAVEAVLRIGIYCGASIVLLK
jgi:hypothetical protein